MPPRVLKHPTAPGEVAALVGGRFCVTIDSSKRVRDGLELYVSEGKSDVTVHLTRSEAGALAMMLTGWCEWASRQKRRRSGR